jgi:hypothetical protein
MREVAASFNHVEFLHTTAALHQWALKHLLIPAI